jgi:hypothetical protein
MKSSILLVLAVALLVGCSKKGENLAGKTGEAVGEKITDFAKGLGKGIDQKMTVEVTLRAEVQALGLSHTVAKSLGLENNKKGISVYFIASQPVATTLVAYAIKSDGVEIGRAKKKVELGKDDAAYISFEFDPEMDSATVSKYAIGAL